MPSFFRQLALGFRHAVVGVVVLGVLMTVFSIHIGHHSADAHECSLEAHHHHHADPVPAADPEGCETSCDCPALVTVLIERDRSLHGFLAGSFTHGADPVVIPDSRSYPPDLPPARLS